MPHLIIGHTTDTTARIWVQGDVRNTSCTVTLTPVSPSRPAGTLGADRYAPGLAAPATFSNAHDPKSELRLSPAGPSRTTGLNGAADNTAVVEFDGLDPNTDYAIRAEFTPGQGVADGRLRTCRLREKAPGAFSFVLSSCNLSVVSITDLLALMTGLAGVMAARRSLDLPPPRWMSPRSALVRWFGHVLPPLIRIVVMGAAGLVKHTTNLKQPAVEYLRSPFLKLSAVFESQLLTITLDSGERSASGFMGVGDSIQVGSDPARGRGMVASVGRVRDSKRTLVLTNCSGHIVRGAEAFRRAKVGRDDERFGWLKPSKFDWVKVGTVESVTEGRCWLPEPSFFLHAGDQIYYDFPKPDRAPKQHEYRRAYRDAWFEDESLKHLLARWPQYMTLDDHELADQFDNDFSPPQTESKGRDGLSITDVANAQEYLREATTVYREYVHALAPREFQQRPGTGPFWYTFAKQSAGFFVLDTRTTRHREAGTMIDDPQMGALLEWLKLPHSPKFIVTSVPFVAELQDSNAEMKREWFRNAQNDKWCTEKFKGQRDRIIDAIAENRVEHVVFLTGDMHCCYHATMRIAVKPGQRERPSKYESITVHEIAGGPVNQLQLATVEEFVGRRKAKTNGGYTYEVNLEQFHGDVSAVMHIAVTYRQPSDSSDEAKREPELVWNVIRTLTDPGPEVWPLKQSVDEDAWGPNPEPVMGGRITFARRRTVDELQPW